MPAPGDAQVTHLPPLPPNAAAAMAKGSALLEMGHEGGKLWKLAPKSRNVSGSRSKSGGEEEAGPYGIRRKISLM